MRKNEEWKNSPSVLNKGGVIVVYRNLQLLGGERGERGGQMMPLEG